MNGCLCCHLNQCVSRLKRAAREYLVWGCVDSCLLVCFGWNDEPKHMDNCRRMECSLVACPKDKLREAVRAEIERNEKHGKLNRSNTAWQIELDIAKETDGEDDDDDDTMDESNEYMQVDADMLDFNLRAEAEAEEDDDDGSSSDTGASEKENTFGEDKNNDLYDNDDDIDDGGSDGSSADSHASSGNHTIIDIDCFYSRTNSFNDDHRIIDDMEYYSKFFDADFSYAQCDYV